ncbi:MAG: tRNA-dihydrouridine synthase family protein [Anaerolineae bacterium]|nr:tRNA-dihydrouridine synthase family protein [Anaerolineae bacterium]
MKPAFFIRDLPIYGDLVLAPLSGYNDQPFRRLCRNHGAALVYTGLLSSLALCYGTARSRAMLRRHPDESPLIYQLYGNDADTLAKAAGIIESWKPDAIDLNLGCAKPKVTSGGNGAFLLQDPAKIGQMITRLVQTVHVPVTAKIRLGWEMRTYMDVARIIEDSGASLLAVHGRTALQAYNVPADWDAIAEVKQALSIPVLASGDVACVADIARIKVHTGCDGVMIGRAAIGNPWIFQRRDLAEITLRECAQTMACQLHMMLDFHGPEHGLLRFRKHIAHYAGVPGMDKATRQRLMAAETPAALLALLETLI